MFCGGARGDASVHDQRTCLVASAGAFRMSDVPYFTALAAGKLPNFVPKLQLFHAPPIARILTSHSS
jgi:hypothetical protein